MVETIRLLPPAELSFPIGEAMFTQRAIRKFKPDPIGDEQLKLILDAASKAPSGGNFQPARFLVVRDRARILALGELYREAWWAKRRDGPGISRSRPAAAEAVVERVANQSETTNPSKPHSSRRISRSRRGCSQAWTPPRRL